MTTYVYKCFNEDCDNFNEAFEVKQSMKDDKLINCNCCKKDKLERIIVSNAPLIFNGNGWIAKGGEY